jgi:hypothetical protein
MDTEKVNTFSNYKIKNSKFQSLEPENLAYKGTIWYLEFGI